MRRRSGVALGLSMLFALSACATAWDESENVAAEQPTDSAASPLSVYPNATFFIVTRPDLRRCAYPLCGGVYAQRVNHGYTVCSDGSAQKDCRILSFDYQALHLDPVAQDQLRTAVEKGQALLRGTIVKTLPIAGRTFDQLVVADAWVARALTTPRGSFSRVRALKLQCVDCPTYRQEILNSATPPRLNHSLIFGAPTFSPTLASELLTAVAARDEGILVAGTRIISGGRYTLEVSEAYTRFPVGGAAMVGGPGDSCGSRGLPLDCEEGLFCLRTKEANCGRADAGGICTVLPMICTRIYKPVCGCDAKTYGNECEAHGAGTSVDYDGPCTS